MMFIENDTEYVEFFNHNLYLENIDLRTNFGYEYFEYPKRIKIYTIINILRTPPS